MKLRMLLVTVLLAAFATVSFSQVAAVFRWTDAETAGWFPVTYNCDGTGGTVIDGTIVEIWLQASFFPGPGDAIINPVGGANFGEFNFNSFPFNSAILPRALGSFQSDVLTQNGTNTLVSPGASGFMHLRVTGTVAGVPTQCWMSSTFFSPPSQYWEIDVVNPGALGTMWTCLSDCDVPGPDGCVDQATVSPFEIATQWGGHGAIPDPDVPESHCLELCLEAGNLDIVIGPLKSDEEPVGDVRPGCLYGTVGCNEECPPAVFTWSGFSYAEANAGPPSTGFWTGTITVIESGCACFTLDDILAAETGSFDASASDNAVELTWNTVSENAVNYFAISRDSEILATVPANNEAAGSHYTYTDNTAHNGVTYEYTMTTVNMDATSEDWGIVATATPNANLAVITEYSLHQNYPNPFNPTTNIVFDLVDNNHVTLTVYNAVGQEVSTLVNGARESGRHNVSFGSDNLTSGLYFYTVQVGDVYTATKKMLLVK